MYGNAADYDDEDVMDDFADDPEFGNAMPMSLDVHRNRVETALANLHSKNGVEIVQPSDSEGV